MTLHINQEGVKTRQKKVVSQYIKINGVSNKMTVGFVFAQIAIRMSG